MTNSTFLYFTILIITLTLSKSFTQKLQAKQWIPISAGNENIINFVIASKQANHIVKANSGGYSFRYDNLPKWVDLVNGATIAGVPSFGSSNLTLTYTSGWNSYTKVIYFADSQSSFRKSYTGFGGQLFSFSKTMNSINSFGNSLKATDNVSSPSVITVVLPTSTYETQFRSQTPILLELQTPSQNTPSINYVKTNSNSYSQDYIQALIVSQQTAENNYLQSILTLSNARLNIQSLTSSVQFSHKNLSVAVNFLNETQKLYNKMIEQQQQSQQRLQQAQSMLDIIQNNIKSEQQKLDNINDLIVTIKSQLVQAKPLGDSASNNKSQVELLVSQAQKLVDQAVSSINLANSNITSTEKKIRESQNIIAVSPVKIFLAQTNLKSAVSRLATAQQQLKAAKLAHNLSKTSYDSLVKQYKDAPSTIQTSQLQISQLKNSIFGRLTISLENSKKSLDDIKQNQMNINQYISLVNNATQTLSKQLSISQQSAANLTISIQFHQNKIVQTNNNLNQLFNNKAISDSNVNILKTQMGLADQNYKKAQNMVDSLKFQMAKAADVYKVAVSSFSIAQAVKTASDSELNKLLNVGLEKNLKGQN